MVAPRRSVKDERASRMLDWLALHGERSCLSIVTVMELRFGARKALHKGERRKADEIETWLDRLVERFGPRVLPLDDRIGESACDLAGRAAAKGFDPGVQDALIAATALRHGLTVATANIRDFRSLLDAIVDPSASL